jgi:hypothetical protein
MNATGPLAKPFLLVLSLSWILSMTAAGCGGKGLPSVPGGGGCPNFASAEAVAKVDFAHEFKLKADVAHKLKAGIEGAVELKAFADRIDADLKVGCGGLAKDLGQSGPFEDGQAACRAAIKAMEAVRAKLGASAHVVLEASPPRCEASMSAMADCAARCDANIKPGSAKVECEPGKLSGSCTGECSGSCDMTAAGSCSGTCEGSCDASFKGSCGGQCVGKCDGKDSKGACSGTCEGRCESHAKGQCNGRCSGGCELKAKGKCNGTCTGSCSIDMKAPKCAGEVKPPQMSAECKAHCDAKVEAKMECTPANVVVRIKGAADAKAANNYRLALEKNLPIVLKIAIGMGHRAEKAAANVQAVVAGLQGSVEAMGKASGDAVTSARLVACVAAPFKGAIDAAANVQASVKVSVDVKASASASGNAGAKAG